MIECKDNTTLQMVDATATPQTAELRKLTIHFVSRDTAGPSTVGYKSRLKIASTALCRLLMSIITCRMQLQRGRGNTRAALAKESGGRGLVMATTSEHLH